MNRWLLALGVGLWTTVAAIAIGAADERLEVLGNVKLLGAGNGVIFPDGTKLTTAGGGSGTIFTGADRTAVGVNALTHNTTGTANTAVGASALAANSTGHNNTAMGSQALASSSTGIRNSAFGTDAMRDITSGGANTAVGESALKTNTEGDFNVAIGVEALHLNSEGIANTAVGTIALLNSTGHSNVALGYGAGASSTTGDYNIYIGNSGSGVDSHTIRIGRTDGVGEHTRAFIAGIRDVTTGVSDAITVRIDSNGQLGTVSSSRRYKEDIRDMGAASAPLMRLRPVTFRYTRAYADGSKPIDYGLVAEEVAEVYPDLVVYDAHGRVESVQYHKLTPLLLNEAQQQHRRVAELEGQVTTLRRELAALTATVRRK